MIREAEAFTVMMKHFMLACYIPASLIRIKCIDCMYVCFDSVGFYSGESVILS